MKPMEEEHKIPMCDEEGGGGFREEDEGHDGGEECSAEAQLGYAASRWAANSEMLSQGRTIQNKNGS